jgi:uncharacterized protein
VNVGTLEIRLVIREARSLKDKRRVLQSLKDRIASHYNVSIAEVGALDSRQQTVLGVAMVANEQQFLDRMLNKIVNAIREFPLAQMVDYELEFF